MSGLRLAVLLDECHRFVNTGMGREFEPILLDLAATFRKRGCGLLLGTQSPSLLPAQIASVVSTRIAFRTVDGRNARSIADSMGLDREQMNYLLELPNRRAIVHYAGWPRPFVIEVPALSFPHGGPAPEEWMAGALKRMKWTAPADAPVERVERDAAYGGTAEHQNRFVVLDEWTGSVSDGHKSISFTKGG